VKQTIEDVDIEDVEDIIVSIPFERKSSIYTMNLRASSSQVEKLNAGHYIFFKYGLDGQNKAKKEGCLTK
jgi:hypothetical protein